MLDIAISESNGTSPLSQVGHTESHEAWPTGATCTDSCIQAGWQSV